MEAVDRLEVETRAGLDVAEPVRAGADRVRLARFRGDDRRVYAGEEVAERGRRLLQHEAHGAGVHRLELVDECRVLAFQIRRRLLAEHLIERILHRLRVDGLAVLELDPVLQREDPRAVVLALPGLRELAAELTLRVVAEQAAMDGELHRRGGRTGVLPRADRRRVRRQREHEASLRLRNGTARQRGRREHGGGAADEEGATFHGWPPSVRVSARPYTSRATAADTFPSARSRSTSAR